MSFDKNLNIDIILFSYTDKYTHIYVEWDRRFQSQNRKIFEYNDTIPLLRFIAGKEELRRVKSFMNRVNINKNI
jgi:hypothetical protein